MRKYLVTGYSMAKNGNECEYSVTLSEYQRIDGGWRAFVATRLVKLAMRLFYFAMGVQFTPRKK